MYFEDFEYDGLVLSDFGYITCTFDGGGTETVSNGSEVNFNTTPMNFGKKYLLSNTSYPNCLETTFSICKDPCKSETGNMDPLSTEDIRELMRWLNRRGFYKFKPYADGYENIFFEGSFNISKIESSGNVIGLELHLITNRPYGLHEPVIHNFTAQANTPIYIIDRSDDVGCTNINMEIICTSGGNLTIHNNIEDRTVVINNCSSGERIILNDPIISSSVSSHKIQNDFNFNFPRLANTIGNSQNIFTFSIPCTVKMTYTPVRKVGL